ncbi:MAG: hypothetical protein PHW65_05620 [Dehalococcoidales bacterium]|nr:hypothetical protein [Dehalococcoidales bacterium]
MQENLWFATDRDTAAVVTATKAGEPGSKNVITSIHAGYTDATQTGSVTISIGAVAVIELDFIGSIEINGIGIEGGAGQAVAAELSAGDANVAGSVLICGFVK